MHPQRKKQHTELSTKVACGQVFYAAATATTTTTTTTTTTATATATAATTAAGAAGAAGAGAAAAAAAAAGAATTTTASFQSNPSHGVLLGKNHLDQALSLSKLWAYNCRL